MTVIKPKQSNTAAPRLSRHAQYVWAAGAKPYPPADHWGTAMLCMACLVAGIVVGVSL